MTAPLAPTAAVEWSSGSYAEAQSRLLAAAAGLGAPVTSYPHPAVGPDGEVLATDVVDLTVPGAERALVLVSGTHGIEGYAGSAIQLHRLARLAELADAGTSVVVVHALNPHGFAHRRRVNEDNVDLNRNFVDHAAPPDDRDYDVVHPLLVPKDWDGPAHAAADAELAELVGERGLRFVQSAITGGQWRYADGLFYGGDRPVWSNETWRTIVARTVVGHRHVAYVDLHTGLGERGHGEPVFRGGRDAGAYDRACRWYGDALTRSDDGTSSSTPIVGNTAAALADGLDGLDGSGGGTLTAITLEVGTRSAFYVLGALRADNWCHAFDDDGPREAAAAQMTEAFAPADPGWWADAIAAADRTIERAISGLLDLK